MGQFEPTTVADWIGFLLVVAVVLWGAWQMLEHYLEHTPFMEERQDQQAIAAEHCEKMAKKPVTAQQFRNIMGLVQAEATRRELAKIQSLRSPLPQHKNQTTPSYEWDELLARLGVPEEDRADIIRGSKLS